MVNITDDKISVKNNCRKEKPDVTLSCHPLRNYTSPPTLEELESFFTEIDNGGKYKPKDVGSDYKLAIIIPYRNREPHLRSILFRLHDMLPRQHLAYGIYVVEEASPTKFNRAMLLNIGFKESIKAHNYSCFIFHDVDMIPVSDDSPYTCSSQPVDMGGYINKNNYTLRYRNHFGGVSAMTKEQFMKVNGFSNLYFGWGAEDEDMANRYKLLKNSSARFKHDGLSTMKYTLLRKEERKLYTWIYVKLDEAEVMAVSL
ncbi:hypothetical protein ScPMuIL_011405 [Solemya velum]